MPQKILFAAVLSLSLTAFALPAAADTGASLKPQGYSALEKIFSAGVATYRPERKPRAAHLNEAFFTPPGSYDAAGISAVKAPADMAVNKWAARVFTDNSTP